MKQIIVPSVRYRVDKGESRSKLNAPKYNERNRERKDDGAYPIDDSFLQKRRSYLHLPPRVSSKGWKGPMGSSSFLQGGTQGVGFQSSLCPSSSSQGPK